MLATPESEADALDPAIVTADQLQIHEKMYHLAFLASLRLRAPWRPNSRSLEAFLVERYAIRDLDVEHADIFGWGKLADAS